MGRVICETLAYIRGTTWCVDNLIMLGLEDYMEKKDLDGIRAWYARQDITRMRSGYLKSPGSSTR